MKSIIRPIKELMAMGFIGIVFSGVFLCLVNILMVVSY